jgi:hypothetical protein
LRKTIIPIIEDPNLVKKIRLGPIRIHRKKRIQKKWNKRYGYNYKFEYQSYKSDHPTYGEVIIAHPSIAAKIRTDRLRKQHTMRKFGYGNFNRFY